ncbi:hypothetical protein N7537_006944 [Penicillium hordei]|uniref:Uncharacterized protein n=1 Tax=Penicillium hordei TaxID=40994 RepID=A0AAD6E8I6_9EURO|nr:uncharacterized protein N7537_006944 [Penicillium hordei]KAJ5603988.1 hypothetical protein N7537_006944 [Penicillium hordei]
MGDGESANKYLQSPDPGLNAFNTQTVIQVASNALKSQMVESSLRPVSLSPVGRTQKYDSEVVGCLTGDHAPPRGQKDAAQG